MALSKFRDTYAWQGAIELGSHLARIADELPATEENGLARQLRKGMVELPATVANNVLRDQKEADLLPLLKLLAAVDLIDRVYPALDTADTREALEHLFDRLSSADYDATKNPPKPKPAPHADQPEPPHPAPETVPVIETAAPPALPPHHEPVHPPVAPHHDGDVNPALKVSVTPGEGHQEN
jgi:hypothetical protein